MFFHEGVAIQHSNTLTLWSVIILKKNGVFLINKNNKPIITQETQFKELFFEKPEFLGRKIIRSVLGTEKVGRHAPGLRGSSSTLQGSYSAKYFTQQVADF